MKHHRRLMFLSVAAATLSAAAMTARAQFSRQRGDSGMRRREDAGPRAGPQLGDPMAAIERELPSLRIDLKLDGEQPALFDSFERQVRNAADAERRRKRQLSALYADNSTNVSADTILDTIAVDDGDRAEAVRGSVERMRALYASLTADQRKQFDKRILQALREPLGSS